jgi:hypothetical protein
VPPVGPDKISVELCGPDGKAISNIELDAPQGAGINFIGEFTMNPVLHSGQYQLKAHLFNDTYDCAETVRNFWVLPPVDLERACAAAQWIGATPKSISKFEGTSLNADQKRLLMIAHPASLTRTDWERVLQEVSGGRNAVIGPLHPQDEMALELLGAQGVKIQMHLGIGNWMGCYHWIPGSPLFSGLPSGGLAGEAYVNWRPRYVMSELGGEVFAGSFSNSQTRLEAPAIFWYSDIERIALGKGHLVFCQYLLFDATMADPLADRLLANLISMLHVDPEEENRNEVGEQ